MHSYILKDENAVFFECGYSCDNEIFIKIDDRAFFITDGRYLIEAREKIKNGVKIIDAKCGLIKTARLILREFGVGEICFDPGDFSLLEFQNLSENLGINFVPRPNFSKIKRAIKSEAEIAILREAARLGAAKFDEFSKFICENFRGENLAKMSEIWLSFHAKNIFSDYGNLGLSFEPIVAINENAAKAHALPTKTALKGGDLLLLDAGVKYRRYCSDRTRTICVGENFAFDKSPKFKNEKQNEIYKIVLEAQNAALEAIRPGVMAAQIDLAARKIIKKYGYEREFFHSTGHGVGIDIHELPVISANSKTIIEKGMVFSVEPGIYLGGEFGVRIEDVVVVSENGYEIL